MTGAIAVVAAIGIAFLAVLMVYVVVPPDGPSLRQAFWPAVIVGIIIGLLTSLFGWVAPLLVRHWLTLGIVGQRLHLAHLVQPGLPGAHLRRRIRAAAARPRSRSQGAAIAVVVPLMRSSG